MTKTEILFDHIIAYHGVSNTLLTWTISILVGSILLVTSTSYNRPTNKKFRLIYLVFIPAWIFAFLSIYYANIISRMIPTAWQFRNYTPDHVEMLTVLKNSINSGFSFQLLFFQLTLLFLAVWLISYLVWWIFTKQTLSK